MEAKPIGKCQVCNQDSTLRCSGCENGPFYCGKDHQAQNWKSEHRAKCPGVKGIFDLSDKTTLYQSTRDLKTGHVFLKRSPIAVFPRQLTSSELYQMNSAFFEKMTGLWGENAHRVLMPCLGCCQILSYNQVMRDPLKGYLPNICSKCEWPVHDQDCEKLHEEECKILKSGNVKMGTNPRVFYFIGYLRCVILKKTGKPEWDELMKMPIFPGMEGAGMQTKSEIVSFIRDQCGLKDVVTKDELIKLADICFSNFLVCNHTKSDGRARHSYIIYKGSHGRVLPHSCLPNAYAYIDKDTFEVTFRTIKPVKAAEILTIDYNPDVPSFYGLRERILSFSTGLFIKMPCKCLRCSDATENGTFYSAIRCECKKCKDGWMCPGLMAPRVPGGDSTWIWYCEKCHAKGVKSYIPEKDMQTHVEKIRLEISGAQNELAPLRQIIKKYQTSLLHPNHYFIHIASTLIGNKAVTLIADNKQYIHPGGKLNRAAFYLHKNSDLLADLQKAYEMNQLIHPGRNLLTAKFVFYHSILLISQLVDDILRNANVELNGYNHRVKAILLALKESLTTLELDPLVDETPDREERKLTLCLYGMALEETLMLRTNDPSSAEDDCPTGPTLDSQSEERLGTPKIFNQLIDIHKSIPDGPNTNLAPNDNLTPEQIIELRVENRATTSAWLWQYLAITKDEFQRKMKNTDWTSNSLIGPYDKVEQEYNFQN